MQSKSLLVAIAAFAVTATGVHAYDGIRVLERANITEEQRSALMEARQYRADGDFSKARDVLAEAGIDEDTLHSLHDAAKQLRQEVREALEADDYDAFKEAIAGTPLDDIITSKDDFEQFRQALELKRSGDWEDAKVILKELGIEPHAAWLDRDHPHKGKLNLTEEQRDALQTARQANDKDAVKAILDEAGGGERGKWRW